MENGKYSQAAGVKAKDDTTFMERVECMHRVLRKHSFRLFWPIIAMLIITALFQEAANSSVADLKGVCHVMWGLFIAMTIASIVSIFVKKHVSYRQVGLVCPQCGALLKPWYRVADKGYCLKCGTRIHVKV